MGKTEGFEVRDRPQPSGILVEAEDSASDLFRKFRQTVSLLRIFRDSLPGAPEQLQNQRPRPVAALAVQNFGNLIFGGKIQQQIAMPRGKGFLTLDGWGKTPILGP
jgi:hypothetical protein